MRPFKKNLHLNRQEAGMILILVLLLSGLMFSVGLWVGIGEQVVVSSDHGEPGREPASEIAEEDVKSKGLPGQTLRSAYQESKKDALGKAMVSLEDMKAPRSILDASAHQESNKQWSRKPASDPVKEAEAKELAKLAEKESARLKRGPASSVKELFERSPDSVKDFEPAYGSFTVQVASFATQDEAFAMVRQLRKSGFLESYSKEIEFKSGEKWHRVAVGSYPNPIFARKVGDRVKKRGLTRDFIVRKVND